MYMFLFLWNGGLPPDRAVYWTMWHGGYDRDAWRSIMDLVEKTKTPNGRRYLASIRVFSMMEGKVT